VTAAVKRNKRRRRRRMMMMLVMVKNTVRHLSGLCLTVLQRLLRGERLCKADPGAFLALGCTFLLPRYL
jgi:hypothetical protein